MRGFHTAALVALVALALCAGGAADNNTPLTRSASNIDTAPARPSLDITATAMPRAPEAQGSGADEFMRKQRPYNGGNNKHGKPHDKGGNNHHGKPQPPPPGGCSDRDDGILCIPSVVTTCKGPLGKCMSGSCEPLNTVSGCPCGDECVAKVGQGKLACLNPLQQCQCDASGSCAPNFLPEETTCIRKSGDLGPCNVGKCNQNGFCANKDAEPGTPCFLDDTITCAKAGSCDDQGSCISLGCKPPCITNADCEDGAAPLCCGGNCVADIGFACTVDGNIGKCCAEGTNLPTHPESSLQCIEAEACPCGNLNYCSQGETCCFIEGEGLCAAECSTGVVCNVCDTGAVAICGANTGDAPTTLCLASCDTCDAEMGGKINCPKVKPINPNGCEPLYDNPGDNACDGVAGFCQSCICKPYT